jgi:iron(III) transport system ATP-binding protein
VAGVIVKSLNKSFGSLTVFDDISFEVPSGQILTLLGPSGCGKTTILRCIAGLEHANHGSISIGGDPVFDDVRGIDLAAEKRSIGMVFQSYAIWPHFSVFDNVAFPLRLRGVKKAQIKDAVMASLKSVDLEKLHDRFPSQLSGGQQQRVVLARCLVYRPRVLLLDEPLANLDAKLREEMRYELREIQQKHGLTCIYVTHDQAEAMALSDMILVLNAGQIISKGSPREVFAEPKHPFIASFLGSSNLLKGVVTRSHGAADGTVILGQSPTDGLVQVAAALPEGTRITIAARPKDLSLVKTAEGHSTLPGRLDRVTYLGEEVDCVVTLNGLEIRVRADADSNWQPGENVHVKFVPQKTHIVEGGRAQ